MIQTVLLAGKRNQAVTRAKCCDAVLEFGWESPEYLLSIYES
jgi:hypothetical protein